MSKMLTVAIVLVVLSVPGASTAQSFELGVKGGVCFATLPALADGVENELFTIDAGWAAGVTVGGAFAFGLTDTLAIQPEVLFVQKASNLELTSEPVNLLPLDVRVRESLNYLELPVLVRLAVGGGGFHVLAGPSLNVSLENWDFVEAIDVGLVIGAGFYGDLLTVEGRYEEGLRDTKLSLVDLVDDEPVRNRAFLVLMGVRR
jgi:hypothetical protein